MSIKRIKKDLTLNRYALEVYRKGLKYKGIKRKLFYMFGGATAVIKHPNLWDYVDEIQANGCIVLTKDNAAKLWIPGCRTDYIQRQIARDSDFYSRDELEPIKSSYIREGMRILDIGANIGNHAVFFATVCKAEKVFSFEPQKDIYSILARNIELNQLNHIVELHNVALGSTKGKVAMTNNEQDNSGAAHIDEGASGDIVLCVLDDFDLGRIDFIKIDVEGFEYDVILGARKLLTKQNPLIYIEVFDENFSKVDALLNELGYEVADKKDAPNYLYKKKQ